MNLKQSGIYTITSPSGKQYVGSAVNFQRRWKKHRQEMRDGSHHNQPLGHAFKKYGLEQLEFSVLLLCRKEDLVLFEQRAIDILKPQYNMCRVAGNCLGLVHSEETIAKRAASNRGKVRTLEMRKASSDARKGTPLSAEHRAKITARQIGSKRNESTRQKMSAAALGKKKSEAHCASNSAAQKGKTMPAETRAKIAATLLGRKHDEVSIAKMSAAQTGRSFSAETLAKMSASHKGKSPTSESKAKTSAALKGIPKSEEAKANMRAAWLLRNRKDDQLTLTTCSDTCGPSKRTVNFASSVSTS